ncbi:TetR/AcrR family transcriptional regulator [Peloplasma aerotolerans]|uniref:TetR/AcrR family transcriptional regulator n=1 Tax=Peloplasma aerotolerans TaxID=3044389 RepID=A0AAW6U7N0_9MOLU|nr:TetR/AcrR family transcriptional regulator [Mariniplasma sp. M4Ah]MDI6452780.1 TetR/AcrR family transcriptional regulator [Mariniplasma sp. M4Ah]
MQTTKDKILSIVISHIKDGSNLINVSLAKIASEAEIGKSTVYEYFNSKEELISETYMYLLKHYESILTSDIEQMDFKGAFIEQIKKILVVMKDARSIMDAIMNHQQGSFIGFGKNIEVCIHGIQKKMEERFESIIKLGLIEGVIEYKEPKPYVKNVIQAVISGLLYQYVNLEMYIEEDELFELIYHQVLLFIKNN